MSLPIPANPEKVTVVSPASCVQCRATYRTLDKNNVDYITVRAEDLSESTVDQLRATGKAQMPLVIFPDGDHVNGFNPGVLAEKMPLLPRIQAVA